jgi:hypothetical protein
LGIANICDLLQIGTDVTYDHLFGSIPYVSKRPKRLWRAFPLALLSFTLVGVLLALVERIGMNKTALLDSDIVGLRQYQSDDGLSDASDSEDKGAGEFANVINEMNNAAGNGRGEEVNEEEDADDAGIGVQGLV